MTKTEETKVQPLWIPVVLSYLVTYFCSFVFVCIFYYLSFTLLSVWSWIFYHFDLSFENFKFLNCYSLMSKFSLCFLCLFFNYHTSAAFFPLYCLVLQHILVIFQLFFLSSFVLFFAHFLVFHQLCAYHTKLLMSFGHEKPAYINHLLADNIKRH